MHCSLQRLSPPDFELAPARQRTPGELVWSLKHCQTSRFVQVTARFETASANPQSGYGFHARSLQIHRFPGVQISSKHPFIPFRLSTSRNMDFLNILASNADVNRGDDQNLVAGLRFENAAYTSSCHSNHPCFRIAPGTTRLLSIIQTLYLLGCPKFLGLIHSCSIRHPSFVFFSSLCNYFLLSPTGWVAFHSLIDIAEQLHCVYTFVIHSFTSQTRTLSTDTPYRNDLTITRV